MHNWKDTYTIPQNNIPTKVTLTFTHEIYRKQALGQDLHSDLTDDAHELSKGETYMHVIEAH